MAVPRVTPSSATAGPRTSAPVAPPPRRTRSRPAEIRRPPAWTPTPPRTTRVPPAATKSRKPKGTEPPSPIVSATREARRARRPSAPPPLRPSRERNAEGAPGSNSPSPRSSRNRALALRATATMPNRSATTSSSASTTAAGTTFCAEMVTPKRRSLSRNAIPTVVPARKSSAGTRTRSSSTVRSRTGPR